MATILIADDDPDICALLEFTMAADGHTVLVEHDGEAALAALDYAPVDLVLLDWMMPRMAGLETCRALRADHRFTHLPVLMLTARARKDDVELGLAAGVDDYIIKPFSPREVAARVADALSHNGF
jgi:DNA-binding response OmpR family regulator